MTFNRSASPQVCDTLISMGEDGKDETGRPWNPSELYNCDTPDRSFVNRLTGHLLISQLRVPLRSLESVVVPEANYTARMAGSIPVVHLGAGCTVYVPNGPFEDFPPIAILGISRELKTVMYQGTPQDMKITGLTPGGALLPLHLKVMDKRLAVAKEYYYSNFPLNGRIIDVREDGEDVTTLPLSAMGPIAQIVGFVGCVGIKPHSNQFILGVNIHSVP